MALKLKFSTSEPGFWVSGVAHAALLTAAMIGLSSVAEFPEAQEGIPVEIVTDARGFTATQLEISLTKALSLLTSTGSAGGSDARLKYSKDY